MDKLRSMEIFVAVIDSGSFTAAAERFGISPVMVGKHMRQLEERLGARLLARTTRRQSLTEIGRQYGERCRQILADIAAAETGAEAMRATPRGLLRVSAPVTFGSQRLAAAVADYLAQHPEVSVELVLNDRVVDMVEEGIDASIRIGNLDDSGLVARALLPYRMQICASPDYLARAGVPKTPPDLARHQCLDYLHWSRHLRWKLAGGGSPGDEGAQAGAPASRFRSNNGQALRMAALRGYGIVMQAEMLLEEDIAAGRLQPLLQDYLPEPRPMHLLYPRDRQPTPKLTSFIDFMLARFGAQAALHSPDSLTTALSQK
ncbi:LysR family transcriptional regulator [Noviherbaspirillum sp. CPCC 100848]|uniref:LysR family transcriptional regulator n=1 Tax=Noviherbaspirillum album TaxID=3080276 RepID=A0ABU6JJ64_9BURK|nr:LysR family transcriptional regulator [Noviherbaspirillum sp. CPCC 100848]MEC4723207.1 LysR family transcriptional regulator [Noviherbaspirillum sp. CPCC 100848]